MNESEWSEAKNHNSLKRTILSLKFTHNTNLNKYLTKMYKQYCRIRQNSIEISDSLHYWKTFDSHEQNATVTKDLKQNV